MIKVLYSFTEKSTADYSSNMMCCCTQQFFLTVQCFTCLNSKLLVYVFSDDCSNTISGNTVGNKSNLNENSEKFSTEQ